MGANCVSGLRSRMSPCELTLAGMLQRHQRSLYLYCRLFLCALILKQSISFDIFQLIGIYLGILWEFQSRLKGFLKDGEMKLSYLIFPLQLLLRKLALYQENRTTHYIPESQTILLTMCCALHHSSMCSPKRFIFYLKDGTTKTSWKNKLIILAFVKIRNVKNQPNIFFLLGKQN